MKTIELRRHAARAKDIDTLSPEGRVQAEDVGRSLSADYDVVFISPAKRAAETVAWLLRGQGRRLPPHAVIPGLRSEFEDRWRSAVTGAGSSRLDVVRRVDPRLVTEESARLGEVVRGLFDHVPDGGRALAVGHSPLIEAAVHGLLGVVIDPLGECEGVALIMDENGEYRVEELRLP
ncbi:MAG TPA: histidine phosphatase family protein [Actinomycetota bacterium]